MRGSDGRSGSLFSYVDLEARVRGDHPLRTIRSLVEAGPAEPSGLQPVKRLSFEAQSSNACAASRS